MANSDSTSSDTFARQLHRGLVNKGMTPAELARQTGLPRGYVAAIMRGCLVPDEDREKLLKALSS